MTRDSRVKKVCVRASHNIIAIIRIEYCIQTTSIIIKYRHIAVVTIYREVSSTIVSVCIDFRRVFSK